MYIILFGDLVRGHWGTLLIRKGIGKQSVSVKISCCATRYVHVPVSTLQPVVSSWWGSVLCLPGVYRKQPGKSLRWYLCLKNTMGGGSRLERIGDCCLPWAEAAAKFMRVIRICELSYLFWHSDLWSLKVEVGCWLKWSGHDLRVTHVLKQPVDWRTDSVFCLLLTDPLYASEETVMNWSCTSGNQTFEPLCQAICPSDIAGKMCAASGQTELEKKVKKHLLVSTSSVPP